MMSAESPIERLSDDLLSVILHLVSRSDGQFQHALVCNKWHRIACRVHDHIRIRKNRRMRPRELLPHLSSFPSLRKLVLADCSLTRAPDSLLSHLAATCPDLTELHIDQMMQHEEAGFTENGLSALFNGCKWLRDLHLICPDLTRAIPDSIGSLSLLTKLYLSAWYVVRLPKGFTSLQSRTHLQLDCINLQELPQDFGDLGSLKLLQLDKCCSLLSLPKSLGRLTGLESLSFSSQRSQGIHLPASIVNLSSLKTLRISNCELTNPLPENFGDLQALEVFSLDLVDGITGLPESLGQLHRLQEFSVYCNDLQSIPESLSRLPSLTSFIMGSGGHVQLPNDIWQISKLQSLMLRTKSLEQPPRSISLFTTLHELTLGESESLISLPEEFGQLTELETLRLHRLDRLTSLPECFHKLTRLKEMTIIGCGQLKHLPSSLGLISSLEVLQISDCDRLVELPDGVGDGLQSLKKLVLRQVPRLRALLASIPSLSRPITSVEALDCDKLKELPEGFGWPRSCKTHELPCFPRLKFHPPSLIQLPHLQLSKRKQRGEPRQLLGNEEMGEVSGGALGGWNCSNGCDGCSGGRGSNNNGCGCKSGSGGSSASGARSNRCVNGAPLPLPSLQSLEINSLPFKSLGPSLDFASSLTKLQLTGMKRLRSLPDSICALSALQTLRLFECKKLSALPETLGGLPALTDLSLHCLDCLRKLPDSLGQLKGLRSLHIFACRQLVRLPESFSCLSSLESCILQSIRITCLPGGLGNLSSLWGLGLDALDNLRSLPDSVLELPGLLELRVRDCKKLARLPPNLQGMLRLLVCEIEGCPLLSNERMVVYGTADLEEGEAAVETEEGGSL